MTKEQKLCVIVPWPHPYLSPNSRINWRLKAEVISRARMQAYGLTRSIISQKEHFSANPANGRINVKFITHPRDKRARDEDNIIASMKGCLDGIADAMKVNDAFFHFKEIDVSYTKRPPEIEVWLTWEEAVNDL